MQKDSDNLEEVLPYLKGLPVASTSEEMGEGDYLLTLYSLGLAIPFFVSAIFFHKLFRLLQKVRFMAQYSTKVMGVILIVVGILFLADYYNAVTIFVNSLFI
jgi:cytochrome c-type biogenesis protein